MPPGTEDDDEGGDEDELAEFDAEVEPKEGGEGIAADVCRLHKAVGKGQAVDAAEGQDHEGAPALQAGGVKAFQGQDGNAEADADFYPMTRHGEAGDDDEAQHQGVGQGEEGGLHQQDGQGAREKKQAEDEGDVVQPVWKDVTEAGGHLLPQYLEVQGAHQTGHKLLHAQQKKQGR